MGIKQAWLAEMLGNSNKMENRFVLNRQQSRLERHFEIAIVNEYKTTLIAGAVTDK